MEAIYIDLFWLKGNSKFFWELKVFLFCSKHKLFSFLFSVFSCRLSELSSSYYNKRFMALLMPYALFSILKMLDENICLICSVKETIICWNSMNIFFISLMQPARVFFFGGCSTYFGLFITFFRTNGSSLVDLPFPFF